jgi:hypothetical protein
VNLTTSSGVKLSPGRPPMVPRIPDIDLINVITIGKDKHAWAVD